MTMMLDTFPNFQSLVRAEVFADFLEMAEHLLEQGYKDPCAVLVGGVLEDHLRSLCQSRGIPLQMSGKPKKADSMNNDLAFADVYSKLDQKNVTAWLDLRNKAAHGKYDEYNADQVRNLLVGVREFCGADRRLTWFAVGGIRILLGLGEHPGSSENFCGGFTPGGIAERNGSATLRPRTCLQRVTPCETVLQEKFDWQYLSATSGDLALMTDLMKHVNRDSDRH